MLWSWNVDLLMCPSFAYQLLHIDYYWHGSNKLIILIGRRIVLIHTFYTMFSIGVNNVNNMVYLEHPLLDILDNLINGNDNWWGKWNSLSSVFNPLTLPLIDIDMQCQHNKCQIINNMSGKQEITKTKTLITYK